MAPDIGRRLPDSLGDPGTLGSMGVELHGSDAFGARRPRRLAGAGIRLARRLKGDPSSAASKATQHVARAAMHLPFAVGYLVFVHPSHDVLLVRWLPGGTYLLLALGYLRGAWRARGSTSEGAVDRRSFGQQPDPAAQTRPNRPQSAIIRDEPNQGNLL